MSVIVKVLAYITREMDGVRELLAFEQPEAPEAGWQVPGGTLEPGEDPAVAVLREVYEESGLSRFSDVVKLAEDRCFAAHAQQWHHRHVFHLTAHGEVPDAWDHRVTAGADDAGLVFRYRWFPLDHLPPLAAQQYRHIHLLHPARPSSRSSPAR